MAIPPRKIRQLPAAHPAKDTDVFPISQLDEAGVPTTRAMTRAQNNAEMIAVIDTARQAFVTASEVEHDRLEAKIDAVQTTPGPKGDAGAVGPAGAKGDTGATGQAGAKGDTGQTGPQGLKGDTGSQGVQGVIGPRGEPGALILGEVDVVDNAVIALGLGVRSKDVTVPGSWGLRTTDTLFVTAATTLPNGYAIDNALPLTTTSIRVYFMAPALALLASNTLKVRVAAIGRIT
jgi:hypothetical protein